LVTGSSEGIGQWIARLLARDGYTITAVARNEAKLKDFIKELGGGGHRSVVADLSTEGGQRSIEAELSGGGYNLLVNNAGVGVTGAFHEAPIDRQVAMLNLNCIALVRLAHAFLKNAKDGDALVNVSSTLAFMPMPGLGLYSATKSFVTAFSDSLWFEQKKRGIYVMALHPGITSTRFQTNAGGSMEDLPKGMAQTPEQVAEATLAALRARRTPTVISGAKNAMLAGLSRLMPRKSAVSMMGRMMEKGAT
jgi:short-subunit dehydrogenase